MLGLEPIFQYQESPEEQIACQAALEATLLLNTSDSSDDDELDSAKQIRDGVKSYKCPRQGCSKIYKNRNGLKYHLQKGSCNRDPHTPPKQEPVFKPFFCTLCQKRYKNLNGLKYHARADHPQKDFNDLRGKDN